MAALIQPVQLPLSQIMFQPRHAIPRRVKQGTMEGSVAVNQKLRFSLIKGLSYHGVYLRFTNTGTETTKTNIEADVSNVKVIVDGVTYVEASPTNLNRILDYYGTNKGISSRNGYLFLDFAGVQYDAANQYAMAWGTEDVGQVLIELTLKGSGTFNFDTVEVIPVYDDVARNLGVHRKIKVFGENLGSAAVDDISDLPKDPNIGYSAIHITPGSGTLKQVTMKVDNQDIYLDVAASNTHLEAERLGRSPRTGLVHLDWGYDDRILQFLPMGSKTRRVGDMRVKPDFTGGAAPSAYDLILETIEGLESLAA